MYFPVFYQAIKTDNKNTLSQYLWSYKASLNQFLLMTSIGEHSRHKLHHGSWPPNLLSHTGLHRAIIGVSFLCISQVKLLLYVLPFHSHCPEMQGAQNGFLVSDHR